MDDLENRQDEINDDDFGQEMVEEGESTGKYDKLLNDSSRRYRLSGMFKEWFLDYSSYVILQRAVPHIDDGLKPVQRRVLHTMFKIDDGTYTKVATIVGEAMKLHPHGDSSILGALVQIGQKNLLVDCQGNWGNILTGDSNAAGRYIEGRLTKFAKEVMFNPKITEWMNSYDGKNQEPVDLPVKFPLLLAQGAEGIAVGLASKILPHNFNELLDASIAILEGQDFELYPDFPTGGYADCSKYNHGRRGGVVKVRAKIEKIDKNTIAITEIPYGKTTHNIIDSILKAKDNGKIKIRKIDDLTTTQANIVIHLPNDVSPDKTIDALYAFTDCEVSISPNTCVIVDSKPQFMSVDEVLRYNTDHTRTLLGRELQLRLDELNDEWHYSSLERIYFENEIYRILEKKDSSSWEEQLDETFAEMKKYQDQVLRDITMEDILKLVEKPIRKISKFDIKALEEKLRGIEDEIDEVKNHLEHLTEFTVKYFRNLKKKYGKDWPRLTEIASFETITATRVVNNNAKLYVNKAEGFAGIGLKKEDNAEFVCDCSDLSEIIVIRKDGKYVLTQAVVGPILYEAKVERLRPTIRCVRTHFSDGSKSSVWAYIVRKVESNQARMDLIADWALKDMAAGHMIIIPFTQVKPILKCIETINRKAGKTVAYPFYGALKKEVRDDTIQKAREYKIKIIVGNMRLLGTGINIPRCSCIFDVTPSANIPMAIQRFSRILTPCEGKPAPIIRYFLDDIEVRRACLRKEFYNVVIKQLGGTMDEKTKMIMDGYLKERPNYPSSFY